MSDDEYKGFEEIEQYSCSICNNVRGLIFEDTKTNKHYCLDCDVDIKQFEEIEQYSCVNCHNTCGLIFRERKTSDYFCEDCKNEKLEMIDENNEVTKNE